MQSSSSGWSTRRTGVGIVWLFLSVALLAACQEKGVGTSPAALLKSNLALQVYKDESCLCCQHWVDHMREAGFEVNVKDTANTGPVKQTLGIDANLQSCHTAVTAEADYYFEGHIPAKIVRQFLENPPAGAVGLAVPGMPIGSPGMEMGAEFEPYDVMLVREDGSTEVYAKISNADMQYEANQSRPQAAAATTKP